MPSRGTTIGIWIGENDDLVDDFDQQLGQRPDYSRSEEVKEAMELYLAVMETVDELPYDIAGPQLRHHVRQAILEKDRREAAAESSG